VGDEEKGDCMYVGGRRGVEYVELHIELGLWEWDGGENTMETLYECLGLFMVQCVSVLMCGVMILLGRVTTDRNPTPGLRGRYGPWQHRSTSHSLNRSATNNTPLRYALAAIQRPSPVYFPR